MLKKIMFGAAAFAVATSVQAVQVAPNLNIEGWVLQETWVDKHSTRSGQDAPSSEPNVFLLHMVNFTGGGELDDGLGWSWKLGHRNRNGNFGGSGATGARDAWLAIDGDFGEVKFGRILNRSFEILDWPYGSEAWLAEATSETGANIPIFARAIRYTAPELASGMTLEATYDVGLSGVDADARAMELYGRWNLGKVRFDLVYQLHTDSPTTKANGAEGVYGADGAPAPTKGNEQSMVFLGARMPFGQGFEGVLAYKMNQWESDTAGFFDAFNWNPGKAATPGTEVKSSRMHVGLNYRQDKWTYSGAVQKVNEGEDNVGGDLDDGATILGLRAVRKIGKAADIYFGLRHTKFDGDYIPVDSYTWQVQNPWDAATKSNTRIGFGIQAFY